MKETLGVKTYSIKETAELLQVTTRTIQNYIFDKRLPAQKIGGKWHIAEDNIKSFLEGKQ